MFVDKYDEPELMYLMCDRIAITLDEVITFLNGFNSRIVNQL